MFYGYLQFTGPGNGDLGVGCTGNGSLMANQVGPNASHRQGYKKGSAVPADSIENLQLSQRNDGQETATIARDCYLHQQRESTVG